MCSSAELHSWAQSGRSFTLDYYSTTWVLLQDVVCTVDKLAPHEWWLQPSQYKIRFYFMQVKCPLSQHIVFLFAFLPWDISDPFCAYVGFVTQIMAPFVAITGLQDNMSIIDWYSIVRLNHFISSYFGVIAGRFFVILQTFLEFNVGVFFLFLLFTKERL